MAYKTQNLEFYLQSHIYSLVKDKFENKEYKYQWYVNKTPYIEINDKLKKASKGRNSNLGKPDIIYFNKDIRLLILVEIKSQKKKHFSNKFFESKKPKGFAIDGALHYASFFEEYDRFQ